MIRPKQQALPSSGQPPVSVSRKSALPKSWIASPLLPRLQASNNTMSADQEITMVCQGSPAPPLEDDNLLSMILCRLPALPSSLPRASLVCKRWRRLVTHPHFHRRFLAHHKKAPLLGFFCSDYNGTRIDFKPALGAPNLIPDARFSSCLLSKGHIVLGCHHGRLLVLNISRSKELYLVVWDPITGDHRNVDVPHMFLGNWDFGRSGMVVCASREKDHVHGACHSEPFQVVLIGCNEERVLACVYSSETYTWGNLISLLQPQLKLFLPADSQSSLVGNSVYWVPVGRKGAVVLEFNLHRQTLSIIDAPRGPSNNSHSFILPADGGGLSFIDLSGLNVHVWKSISNNHGVAGWLFENTVELSKLLSLKPRVDAINIQGNLKLVGYDEDNNVIFRLKDSGIVYLVHLKTMQFKELSGKTRDSILAHPFSNFYTLGMHPKTGMHGDENV